MLTGIAHVPKRPHSYRSRSGEGGEGGGIGPSASCSALKVFQSRRNNDAPTSPSPSRECGTESNEPRPETATRRLRSLSDRFVFSLSIVRAVNFSLQGGRVGLERKGERLCRPFKGCVCTLMETFVDEIMTSPDIPGLSLKLPENSNRGALPNRNESEG